MSSRYRNASLRTYSPSAFHYPLCQARRQFLHRPAQDSKCQAVDEFPITVIELTERGRIPGRGAQQLLIRLGRAVGSVGAWVQTRFPLAQEKEPTHERRMYYVRTIQMDADLHGSAGPTAARPMTLARPSPIVPLGCAAPVVRSTVYSVDPDAAHAWS